MRDAIYGNSLIWTHFRVRLYPTDPQKELPQCTTCQCLKRIPFFKQELKKQFLHNLATGTHTSTSLGSLSSGGTCFQWHEGRVYLAESDGNICIDEERKTAGNLIENERIGNLIGNGNQIKCLEIHAPFLCSHAVDGIVTIWNLEASGGCIFQIQDCEKFKIHNQQIYALTSKENDLRFANERRHP